MQFAWRLWAALSATFFLCSCASTQLNYNTLDLASSTNSLVTQQVLYNFASFIENPAAFPSQITVSSGGATTSASINPSITAPLSKSYTGANITSAAAQFGNATAAKSLQVSASDAWNQNWSYAPITDPEKMKRLVALYRYAVDWSGRPDGNRLFVKNYPPIQRAVSRSQQDCLYANDNKQVTVTPDNNKPDITLCASQVTGTKGRNANTRTFTDQSDDPYYLRSINCVLCQRGMTKAINENLHGPWLHWEDSSGGAAPSIRAKQPDDVYIGSSGNFRFYATREDAEKFVNFTVAILAASTQSGSTAAAATASSSSGSGKGAASVLYDLQNNQFLVAPN